MTKNQILKILKRVIDPELGIDIVTLGLIYNISIDNKKNALKIVMTLTSPFCPFNEYFLNQIRKELQKLKFKKIDIALTFDPPWTPERIKTKTKK